VLYIYPTVLSVLFRCKSIRSFISLLLKVALVFLFPKAR